MASLTSKPQLLSWIQSFDYPHCSDTESLADLRSGIALCQIIYDRVLGRHSPKFLSQVLISNLDRQRCLSNLLLALQYLGRIPQLPQTIKQLRAEQIYNEESKMQLLLTFLHGFCDSKLEDDETERQTKARSTMDNQMMPRRPPLPRSSIKSRQAVEHHNQSGFSIQKQSLQKTTEWKDQGIPSFLSSHRGEKQAKTKTIQQESPIKFTNSDQVPTERRMQLCHWLNSIQLIKLFEGIQNKLPQVCRNGALFIDLLNWLSGRKSVIAHPVGKNQSQLVQATFRKVLSYLGQFQRMNPRYLLNAEQLSRGQNQQMFWGLLDDIYHWHHNKISKFDRRYWKQQQQKKRTVSQQKPADVQQYISAPSQPYKQQLEKHRRSSKMLTGQSSQSRLPTCNKQNVKTQVNQEDLEEVYQWIRQLGYSYSLDKALSATNKFQNCLTNGTLLGSIVMRLQIAKLNLIKEPTEQKHIKHNFQQISNHCVRRLASLQTLVPPFDKQKILLWMKKLKQLVALWGQQPIKNSSVIQSTILYEPSQEVRKWLDQLAVTDVRRDFTRIATNVLKVDVCRETTDKIQLINLSKILQNLRRIGISRCLPVTPQDILDEQNPVVWELVHQLYHLKHH